MAVVCLIISVMLGTAGHILTKQAVGSAVAFSVFTNWKLAAGAACYFASFLAWLPWLASRPAGLAVPAAGLTYAAVFLWDAFVGGQHFGLVQTAGLGAVICGVWMLAAK